MPASTTNHAKSTILQLYMEIWYTIWRFGSGENAANWTKEGINLNKTNPSRKSLVCKELCAKRKLAAPGFEPGTCGLWSYSTTIIYLSIRQIIMPHMYYNCLLYNDIQLLRSAVQSLPIPNHSIYFLLFICILHKLCIKYWQNINRRYTYGWNTKNTEITV